MAKFKKTDKYLPCDPERFLFITVEPSNTELEIIIDWKRQTIVANGRVVMRGNVKVGPIENFD